MLYFKLLVAISQFRCIISWWMTVYFGDHEDTDHFVLPSLEVAPGEAGNVRDVDGSGFIGGRHC